MKTIDGNAVASKFRARLADEVALLRADGRDLALAVILVGDDPASAVYVRRKVEQATEVGIRSIERRLPTSLSEAELVQTIAELNADPAVTGILLQLPLPRHIDSGRILNLIHPDKDVDGFHPMNIGRLANGTGGIIPCTPLGCILLLETVVNDFRGKHAVVIGRSNIVGKPMSLLLLERGCTVVMTHSQTRSLPEIVREADIVIAAVGRPEMVRGDWIKPGAVVIDVGINRVERDGKRRLVGDVEFAGMAHADAVTPVPGGVGPMTIACLLANTVRAGKAMGPNAVAYGDFNFR
ncbi:bifunctional methylenetetrahydrofolate dehydrogenase/methenyltetrahydrofolate cyclohydrolase FolD [Sphingopyxis alaskensis]|jgi:methylenetetrahydrofolate dehydrogenase (NADP+)/methenyltetrahydrofolate cyclohydrolase|uniref:bifunctional methylenetetrahydrofolate dehydrogenase/methenyltetrahydrofolate cyclohydrolase FolD n=1 Tax=Sphingopyxis alaskensis TaxID=117207 RepID=UPI00199E81B6|nr:bifunctional methylenetetrahydrofolate dehydrogenase/methenyltetrahydrofolate cyclohydrolase FolD [Sphingopyxis alaskensis]MBD3744924.1 bifunctional methylenetetrahydrofolate dehydrogenase/methenyltetrahydrofolate cyclohydrolase FolD [Sphingopyxis terrae]MCM3420219.1 bifunctional methylenetetrahydrofolate dehydrogenase/methenyltetrahydrofolate cyclohydrolase FolD [Sphingopyxis alaskensis]